MIDLLLITRISFACLDAIAVKLRNIVVKAVIANGVKRSNAMLQEYTRQKIAYVARPHFYSLSRSKSSQRPGRGDGNFERL